MQTISGAGNSWSDTRILHLPWTRKRAATRKVAIVAASFRMPGTAPSRFWDDLLAGRNLVSRVDPSRFTTDAYLHPNKTHPGTAYTFAAGSIGDVSGFDAGFFSISPREAALMDPQQRLPSRPPAPSAGRRATT